jgi:geranylgeranyl diphosphate synthase type II
MDGTQRIEAVLEEAVASCEKAAGAPPALAAVIRYSVFPAGARVRPRLTLAIAAACGDSMPGVSDGAAAAIELLHCASLIHDDLPCFDNAATRRGKLSVHRKFGERLAVLGGDALIVLAFQTLARTTVHAPERLANLLPVIANAVGAPTGIAAGQAWECEPAADLGVCQRQKTGALFVAAVAAGALAAGSNPVAWTALGERLGEAYQVADDIRDATAEEAQLGKPVNQDVSLGYPNAVTQFGLTGAIERFDQLIRNAVSSIPRCSGGPMVRHLIRQEAERLVPAEYLPRAA